MKAYLYSIEGKYYLFLCNGAHRMLTLPEIRSFLENYENEAQYSSDAEGASGCGMLMPAKGELLLQVSDTYELTFASPEFFHEVFQTDTTNFLNVIEYAEKVGRKRNIVARMCRNGRIPGAIQRDGRWLIPEDAKYPV